MSLEVLISSGLRHETYRAIAYFRGERSFIFSMNPMKQSLHSLLKITIFFSDASLDDTFNAALVANPISTSSADSGFLSATSTSAGDFILSM